MEHSSTLIFTLDRIANVKLKDEKGLTKFNPPSLRGVSQDGRYFHDSRAANSWNPYYVQCRMAVRQS